MSARRVVRACFALSIAFAMALPTSGCSGMQTAPTRAVQDPARVYFPLAKDAAWSYDSQEVDRDGVPVNTAESTLLIYRVERDDGAGGYYIRTGRNVAVYEYGKDSVQRNGATFLLAPFEKGSQWEGRAGDLYTIANVGLSVTEPAGKFEKVIEVKHQLSNLPTADGTRVVERYYYAPEVGLVEAWIPVVQGGGVRWFRLRLRGYTLDGQM